MPMPIARFLQQKREPYLSTVSSSADASRKPTVVEPAALPGTDKNKNKTKVSTREPSCTLSSLVAVAVSS